MSSVLLLPTGRDAAPRQRPAALPSPLVALFDRDAELAVLRSSIDEARSGSGGSVVVRGEAGCGKTSLIRAAVADLDSVDVVWSACEPLSAPRPLGPIRDARAQLRLTDSDDHGSVESLFDALRRRPVVFVVEDLHWADDATLDVITRLAGRMSATPSTLVVSHRISESGALRRVLGQLARTEARYVDTPALSRSTVAAMAMAAGRDPDVVYELTAGVPFLVSAVLDAPPDMIPFSASDAILASTAGLDGAEREALEVIACVPRVAAAQASADRVVPLSVLQRVGIRLEAIDGAQRTGLIDVEAAGAVFRHELGRLAVESTLSPIRRRTVHSALRDAFAAIGADAAVVAQHAIEAGDDDITVDVCDEAATSAIANGAHRQARSLLGSAVDAARRTRDPRLVDLAERSARQRYLTNDLAGAIDHQRLALGILLAEGTPEQIASAHVKLARYTWFQGDGERAMEHIETALGVLGEDADPVVHAQVLTTQSHLSMLRGDRVTTERASKRVLQLLPADRRPDLRASVLNNMGTMTFMAGDESGLAILQEALDIGPVAGEEYARVCTNAAYALTETRRLAEAEAHIVRGFEYAAEHELDTWVHFLTGIRARWRQLHGNTAAAIDDADLVDLEEGNDLNRILPALVRATIGMRRGDPDADGQLVDLMRLTARFDEAHRTGPALCALAERAWLRNEPGPVDVLQSFLDQSADRVGPMIRGEVATWLHRFGATPTTDIDCAGTPHQDSLVGRHAAAADRWRALGAHYDCVLSLIDDGSGESLLEARRVAERLDAPATVQLIDQRLSQAGVPIPRGPRPTTLANVAQLTSRQLEVLDLLAKGRTNSEIAAELYISLKTAGHHVSAILTKLGAKRRAEAAVMAHELGLVYRPADGRR